MMAGVGWVCLGLSLLTWPPQASSSLPQLHSLPHNGVIILHLLNPGFGGRVSAMVDSAWIGPRMQQVISR